MTDRPAPETKNAMLPVEVKMSQRQVDAMGSSSQEAFVAIDAHHVGILRDKHYRPIGLKVSLVNLFGEVENCVLPLKMKRRWLRRHERELAAERSRAAPSPEPSKGALE